MFRMIVADDEPSTLQGIRTAINWSMLDVEIIAEAENGIEALDLVRTLNPDLLICDIRMPKMDGLTLAGILRTEKPNLQILFLSGYSDKDYLKTAIRLDAVDYLYKPFELDELVAAVKKAKNNLTQYAMKEHPLPDHDLALKLLDKNCRDSLLEAHALPLDLQSPFQTLAIRIKEESGLFYPEEMEGQVFSELIPLTHRYQEQLHQAAREIWGPSYVLSPAGNGFIIHAGKPMNKRTVDHKILFEPLLLAFEPVSSRIAIGVSSVFHKPDDVKQAFIEARKAALSAFLLGYGRIISFFEVSQQPFSATPGFAAKLVQSMIKDPAGAAHGLMKDYLRYMISCAPDDIPKMKDELVQIALLINSRLNPYIKSPERSATDMIQATSDIRDIGRYLLSLIDQYQEEASKLSSMGRLVYDVERYILSHIESYDLSLNTIAEQVYVTPTYLCYVYKKKTGRTINQFILDARMKRAEELVLETNLQLGEIATRLGYANQNYFTKIFTRYFGISPSAYRNKAL